MHPRYWLKSDRQPCCTVIAAIVITFALLYQPGEARSETPEQAKYRKLAWEHFGRRCRENAGEKIFKTAENVDGIFIMKLRPFATYAQLRDQYWMGDPYGNDWSEITLQIKHYLGSLSDKGILVVTDTERRGFKFVEINDPKAIGGFVRYSLDTRTRQLLESKAPTRSSNYGVTWEDISTSEDRKYWVAGGRFQVIDLKTNDLLAERTGYLFEAGFGSTGQGGARSPWLAARDSGTACPPVPRNVFIDRIFVEKVLKPSAERNHGK